MSDTIVKPLPYRVDLAETIKKTYLDTLFATEDNEAHRFDIALFKDKAQLNLPSGTAVNGYFIRYSGNVTIPLNGGSVSGNVCSVTLKKSCYNKSGQFALVIKATADGVTNTIFYGEGTMFASTTDTVMDEENIIPSLEDLLAQIATIEAATKAANNAATNATNAAARIDGLTVSATSGTTAKATVSEKNGVHHIDFVLPKGAKGDPGTIENVTITSINGLTEALAAKLGTNEQAADSAKLGGKTWAERMLEIYPIGSIYMSVNNTSPASLFGGAWEQLKDRFLLGAGDSYAAGSTGGEETHTLTVDEMPNHAHTFILDGGHKTEWQTALVPWKSTDENDGAGWQMWDTGSAGGNQAHNNMPPYLAVYMWKRVS